MPLIRLSSVAARTVSAEAVKKAAGSSVGLFTRLPVAKRVCAAASWSAMSFSADRLARMLAVIAIVMTSPCQRQGIRLRPVRQASSNMCRFRSILP
jgi:hypothetical protein